MHDLYPFMVVVDIVDVWRQRAPLLTSMIVGSFLSMAEGSRVWRAVWELSRFPPARRVADVSLERERERKRESRSRE